MRSYVIDANVDDISFIPNNSAVFKDGCGFIKHADDDLNFEQLRARYNGECIDNFGEFTENLLEFFDETNNGVTEPVDMGGALGIRIDVVGEYHKGMGATITEIKFTNKLGANIPLTVDNVLETNLQNPEYLTSNDWNFSNMFNNNDGETVEEYKHEADGKISSALFNVNMSNPDDKSSFTIGISPDDLELLENIDITTGSPEERIPKFIEVYLLVPNREILLNRIDFIGEDGNPLYVGLMKPKIKRSSSCEDLALGGATSSGLYYVFDSLGKSVPVYCIFNTPTSGTKFGLNPPVTNTAVVMETCIPNTGGYYGCLLRNLSKMAESVEKDPNSRFIVEDPVNGSRSLTMAEYYILIGIYDPEVRAGLAKEFPNPDLPSALDDLDSFTDLLSTLTLSSNSESFYTNDTVFVNVTGYHNNKAKNLQIIPKSIGDVVLAPEEFFSVAEKTDLDGNPVLDLSGNVDVEIVSNMKVGITARDWSSEGSIEFSDGYKTEVFNYSIKPRGLSFEGLSDKMVIRTTDEPVVIKYFGAEQFLSIDNVDRVNMENLSTDVIQTNAHEGTIVLTPGNNESIYTIEITDTITTKNITVQIVKQTVIDYENQLLTEFDFGDLYLDDLENGNFPQLNFINTVGVPFTISAYGMYRYAKQNWIESSDETVKSLILSVTANSYLQTNNLGNKKPVLVNIIPGRNIDNSLRDIIPIKYNLKRRMLINYDTADNIDMEIDLYRGNKPGYNWRDVLDLRVSYREGTIEITVDDPTICSIGSSRTWTTYEQPIYGTYHIKGLKKGETTLTITDGKSTKFVNVSVVQMIDVENKRLRTIDVYGAPIEIDVLHPHNNEMLTPYFRNLFIANVEEIYSDELKKTIRITPKQIGDTNLILNDGIREIDIPFSVKNLSNQFYVEPKLVIDMYKSLDTDFYLNMTNIDGDISIINDSPLISTVLDLDNSRIIVQRFTSNSDIDILVTVTNTNTELNKVESRKVNIKTFKSSFYIDEEPFLFEAFDSIADIRDINSKQEDISILPYDETIVSVDIDNINNTVAVTPLKSGSIILKFVDSVNELQIPCNVQLPEWSIEDAPFIFYVDSSTTFMSKNIVNPPNGLILKSFDSSKVNVTLTPFELIVEMNFTGQTSTIIELEDESGTILEVPVFNIIEKENFVLEVNNEHTN